MTLKVMIKKIIMTPSKNNQKKNDKSKLWQKVLWHTKSKLGLKTITAIIDEVENIKKKSKL